MTPLELSLRRLAASLDAPALETLASKGLLRRAQKDRERGGAVSVLGETPGGLRVQVGDAIVTMPASSPATARCSCPAGGVCQHILGALLFLQPPAADATPAAPALPPPEIETKLLALTADQLERWAGKPAFRAGCELAARGGFVIVHEHGLLVRLPALKSSGGLERSLRTDISAA